MYILLHGILTRVLFVNLHHVVLRPLYDGVYPPDQFSFQSGADDSSLKLHADLDSRKSIHFRFEVNYVTNSVPGRYPIEKQTTTMS